MLRKTGGKNRCKKTHEENTGAKKTHEKEKSDLFLSLRFAGRAVSSQRPSLRQDMDGAASGGAHCDEGPGVSVCIP